jgi:hypothetical protein
MCLFSYFPAPVSTRIPSCQATLSQVFKTVTSNAHLVEVTRNYRKDGGDKTAIFPSVSCSGLFSARGIENLISYSGIICMDIDKCPDMTVSRQLILDQVFKPSLLFISPSGCGIKVFYAIQNALQENHKIYFLALSHYLLNKYGVVVDKSCKDIPRLCFLCHDPDAYYFPCYIESDDLLDYYHIYSDPEPVTREADSNPAGRYFEKPFRYNSFTNSLNAHPLVHQQAVQLLIRHGWQPVGNDHLSFTRPGKEKGKTSAKFYFSGKLYFFNQFSSTATDIPLGSHTDVEVIAYLEYNGDFKACCSALYKLIMDSG